MKIDGYEILNEIARGGMGVVYRARGPGGQIFALKVLLDRDPDSLARFEREAALAQSLVHPHVVRVHGAGIAGGKPYLVMDCVEGEDLTARLKRDGPLPEVEARRLFLSLVDGLGAAHALGIVHRDLKPQNVLLEGAEVYLTDFGLARRGPSTLTATGELLGTPAYMAPEQALGDRDAITPATDVYGLGATLYAALCGDPPHQGASLYATLDRVLNAEPIPLRSRRSQDLSPGLEDLVMSCLRREPSERPSLEKVRERLSASAGARRGGRALFGGVAAALLVPSLLALGLFLGLERDEPNATGRSSRELSRSPSLAAVGSPSQRPEPRLVSDQESRALALANLGAREMRQRNFLEAQGHLEQALALDPACDEAHLALGTLALTLGDWGLAERAAGALSSAAPPRQKALAYGIRGRARLRIRRELPLGQVKAGYLEACEAEFRRSLEEFPTPKAWIWLGFAQLEGGKRAAAEESLREALKLSSADPDLLALELELEPSDEKLREYVERRGFQGASFEVGLKWARYCLGRDEATRAVGVLEQIEVARPNERRASLIATVKGLDDLARRAGALSAKRQGTLRTLLGGLTEALEGVAPGSLLAADLLEARGLVRLNLGDPSSAAKDLEAALEIQEKSTLRFRWGGALQAEILADFGSWDADAFEGILDSIDRKLVLDSEDAPAALRGRQLLLRGWVFSIRSEFVEAEKRFAQALKVLIQGRARQAALGGGVDQAGLRLRELREEISRSLLLLGRARILARAMGFRTRSAVQALIRAAKAAPSDYSVKAWLVNAYTQEGRPQLAASLAATIVEGTKLEDPARTILRLLTKSREDVKAFMRMERGNPRVTGIAIAEHQWGERLLLEAPHYTRAHPLVAIPVCRVARRSGNVLRLDMAVDILDRVIDRLPGCNNAIVERGQILAKQGKFKEALADLEHADSMLPSPAMKKLIEEVKARRP